MGKMDKRFQECNSLVKLLRYRWYLLVYFKLFYYTYFKDFKVYEDKIIDGKVVHTDEYQIIKGKRLLMLLKGIAQGDMNWYHTSEEVLNKFKNNEGEF